MQEDHLIVFAHGLQGVPEHGLYVMERFHQEFPKSKVHLAQANKGILKSFFSTGDGIEAGGTRLFQEVESIISSHSNFKTISFIGSSLGGVYSRYCIGLLQDKDFFGLKPLFFASLASPHQGIRSLVGSVDAYFASWLFPQTTKDLMLDSSVFARLADPEDIFYKGLARFEKRIAYSSCIEDHLVPFPTGIISNLSFDVAKTKFADVINEVEQQQIVLEDHGDKSELFSCDDLKETYYGKSVDKQDELHRLHKNLASLTWNRIAVRLSHKHIACPFPSGDVSREFLITHLLTAAVRSFIDMKEDEELKQDDKKE
jgi:hypothetical protein